MATPPRLAIPGAYVITRSTVQGESQLVPGDEVNSILKYYLALAACRYGVTIPWCDISIDATDIMVTDPDGTRISAFCRYFFGMTGRAINRLRGRSENLWNSRKPSLTWVAPHREDLVEQWARVRSFAVLDGLVECATEWQGLALFPADSKQSVQMVPRPSTKFFRRSRSPKVVPLQLSAPKALDSSAYELLQETLARSERLEKEVRVGLETLREKPLGMHRIRSLRAPEVVQRRRCARQPRRFYCQDDSLRRRLFALLKSFLDDYRSALTNFCEGAREVVFPWGTLKMVELFKCRCRGPDSNTARALGIQHSMSVA